MMRMMWIGLVATVLLGVRLAAQKPQAAETLLQTAIKKEVVDGDLKGAIEQYKKVAQSGNRAVAAQALLHMAECYQKLGDAESRKVYERILREFGDQPTVVATAKARLGGAATQAAGITTRQAWTGPKVDPLGTVSADGHYLSFVDWDTGDLAIHDLKSGEDRRLTNKGAWAQSNDFAEESVISPDGRQVAYAWLVDKETRYELRLVNSSGNNSTPRVLYSNEDVVWLAPYDWSLDGRWIAIQIQRRDNTAQMGVVDATTGALRVLKSIDWRLSTKLSFSPDGKYVAYDLPSNDDIERDIFILAIDGSREIPAVVHPAMDTTIGWTPDGRTLLFASDRTGNTSVWGLPFQEGKPQGTPELIKADIGRMQTVSLTRTGTMYFSTRSGGPDLYTASVDFTAGKVLASVAPVVDQFVHANREADWSPDGKQVVFVIESNSAGHGVSLGIRTMDNGRVRQLHPKLNYFQWPRWSPDSRSLIVQGTDLKGRQGIYRIDLQTGDAEALVLSASPTELLVFPQWTPDGKKLLYVQPHNGGQFAIIERDGENGMEREVIRKQNLQYRTLSVSPDSRYLTAGFPDPASKRMVLTVVPLEGGDPREIVRLPFGGRFATWSPDGGSILYTQDADADGDGHSELWMVPVAGGQPKKLDVGVTPIRGLRVQPGGNKLLFWTLSSGNREEIWAMDNFLPKGGN